VKVPSEVELSSEEGFHLVRVLRRTVGDSVLLVCDGGVFDASILRIEEGSAGCRVWVSLKGPATAEPPRVLDWSVAVALGKGESFEVAVRTASELGMEAILPVFTCRTAVRPPVGTSRIHRWGRVALESAKQCGRARPLRVEAPVAFPDALEEWLRWRQAAPGETKGWIAVPSAPLRLDAFLRAQPGLPGEVALSPGWFFVGPEGGFSPEEVALGRGAGLLAVGFPTPVLRVATAVALICALGVVLESLGGSGFRVDCGGSSG
jgi:16S rRNA (uracil1498-N3)-methyltransferase